MKEYFPIIRILERYQRSEFTSDLFAALIVTALLIPQSLGYALIVGVPAEIGLYASIFPLLVYGVMGTSRTLSVGPVAVVSLMTMAALQNLVQQGTSDYLSAVITLSMMSGMILLFLGIFRFGFIVNFLSHSVISGFITAAALIIAGSQIKHLIGIPGDQISSVYRDPKLLLEYANFYSAMIGLIGLVVFYSIKKYGIQVMKILGLKAETAAFVVKLMPIVMISISIAAVCFFQLDQKSVAIIGYIPSALPSIQFPLFSIELIKSLMIPAFLISLIGYVESISVSKTLAAKRQQSVDSNQELVALGVSNIASSLSGAFPVTGGLSRSIVNFESGAITQMASIYAALGIGMTSLLLAPVFFYLSKPVLAAIIIVSVMTMIDLKIIKRTWHVSKKDFAAVLITILSTLVWGVEIGVLSGILVSLVLHLYRTTKPHIAEVGLIEGSEHFRNIKRHRVRCENHILSLRLDESLFFANADRLSNRIYLEIKNRNEITDIVLMFSAVNYIDYSALEVIEDINSQLKKKNIRLHLSEVKGPVMDVMNRTNFVLKLSGKIYLSQFSAVKDLADTH